MKIYHYSLITFGGRRICIGKQGENLATRIDVDVTPWKTEYPTGIISLFVVPPVGNGYLAAIEIHENTVRWPIRDTDTAYDGSGRAELILKDADGTVIKSVTAYTTCTPSVSATEPADPPEAIRPWVEQILDAIASGALAGIGIESLEQTTISTDDSGINIWTATLTDGSTYQFEVRNGQRGADGAPGEKGEKGEKGDTGEQGPQGEPGSIESLTINGKTPDDSGTVTLTPEDLGAATAEEVSALKSDLVYIVEKNETWSDYEWIETADEQSTGRILVGWNMEKYPDGSWLNKGADSYSYKKFNCDGIDKFKISYSTVQNKVANYAFYDSNENLVSIYPTTALGTESQLTDKEVEVPSGAKWLYVVTRTEGIATYGFKIYKSTKTITKSLNSELLQKKFDSFTDNESSIIINRHVVNDNSVRVNEIGALNEYKYPLFPYFCGEYLEHWYEKIYDGTESIIVDIEGDSISQGYTGQNCFLGMRDFAIKKIMKNGGYDLSKLTVFNNAIGGCSTNDWVGRTEYFKGSFQTEEYYSKYAQGMLHYGMEQNPDLMIIGFGMNDAMIDATNLNLKQRLDLFESNFREALQRIRGNENVNGREAYNKGVDSLSIIITNITNTNGYEERKLKNWHIYVNEIIKELCHEYKCAYVDFTTLTYGYTTGYGIYSQIKADGQRVSLHPNKYQMAYLMSYLKDLIYPVAMHNVSID